MPSLPAPSAPRFEHLPADRPALGVGTATPRLSWRVAEAPDGYRQAAYEVAVRRPGAAEEVVAVESADQVLVPWPAAPLASREAAEVAVRVRGADGDWSPWSESAAVEAGLLQPGDWTARFVSPRRLGAADAPAPVLRGRIELPDGVVRARLHVTAHGVLVPFLNGERVGDEQLAPGWTSYEHRLRYRTHDVTDLVRPGTNELEVLLGNGWYRGRLGFTGGGALYGNRLALLAQLEATTADGAVLVLATDGSWTARESNVLDDQIYDGQLTDLRRDPLGRDGEDDEVEVLDADLSGLVAPDGPPVRITEVLPAVEVFASPSGRTLVDFGQNVVGWVRLRSAVWNRAPR